jgi:hypothetical protein
MPKMGSDHSIRGGFVEFRMSLESKANTVGVADESAD